MNTLNGVTPVRYGTGTEYVNQSAVKTYVDNIKKLQDILNKDSASVTGSDYATLRQSVNNLLQLAHSGVTDTTTGQLSFINYDMAQNLSLVLASLEAAGLPISKDIGVNTVQDQFLLIDSVNVIKSWQDLKNLGVSDIINSALQVAQGDLTRSLQSLIELEYVKEGNNLISSKLADLEQSLEVTQKILDTLTIVQGISNQITAPDPGTFNKPDSALGGDSITDGEQAYKSAASGFFKQYPPTATPDSDSPQRLIAAKSSLMQQLVILDKITPQQTVDGVNKPAHDVENTLANFVFKVISDISSSFIAATGNGVNLSQIAYVSSYATKLMTGLKAWILDNQDKKLGVDGSSIVGNIQNHITQAVQAAQSLNDTEKENVRNYMFIFQQFYQSASTVLTKVNQIVEKMAQGISR